MCLFIKKIALSSCLIVVASCTSYRIPIQTENHPASTDAVVYQIELSPILDINENNSIEESEDYVHPHY